MTQRNTSRNRQPANEPEGVTGETIATSRSGDASAPVGTKARTLADLAATESGKVGKSKAMLLGTVRQHLAELVDLSKEVDDSDAQYQEQAGTVVMDLYQAQSAGQMTRDEVSALLGDYFGFKTKKDGSPSKTPDGKGNGIRQRVVRFVAMDDFLAGKDDGGAFFRALAGNEEAIEQVESIRNRMQSGQLAPWRAYKELGEIKAANTTRPKLAFDPSRISALANELADVEAIADAWRDSKAHPGLLAAYVKLHGAIGIVLDQPID